MKEGSALVGDAPRHLAAESRSLAAHDESRLGRHRGGDLNFFEDLYGSSIVAVTVVKRRCLTKRFVDRLDGLVLEKTRRLYFAFGVAY